MGTEQRSNEKPRMRLVGAAAIAFVVSVVIENAVFAATGAQTYGAPIEEVLAYYAANRDAVAIASVWWPCTCRCCSCS